MNNPGGNFVCTIEFAAGVEGLQRTSVAGIKC
jgi:hypothetical protein